MSNAKTNRRIILYCIYLNLLLWTFRTYAEELPPDPDNAALLYFQALSLWSDVQSSYADTNDVQESKDNSDSQHSKNILKSNEALDLMMIEASRQSRQNGESRRSLMRKRTIDIVETASRIPRCTWGIYHSKGWELLSLGSLRQLALLLDDDAQVLADAGKYRVSLERCITIHRFAQHIGCEEINNYLIALQIDGLTFQRIRKTLGSTPPDIETLLWLRDELAKSEITSQWLLRTLKIDYERALQKLYISPITVERIRNRFMGELLDVWGKKQTEESFSDIEDEKLIPLIQEHSSPIFAKYFESLEQAIEADETFTRTSEEIELLKYKLRGNEAFDVFIPLYDLTHIMHTTMFYSLQTNLRASTNVTIAAIEIYLVKARTGKLPDVLPDGLPRDPFSGQPFEYKKTEQGFILSFDKDRVSELRIRQFEFKVAH